MAKFESLFEDENDIFTGSAKSKFWDILKNANKSIVEDELDKLFEKFCAIQMLLNDRENEKFDLENEVSKYIFNNLDSINEAKKSLYMQVSSDIICRLDS